MDLQEIERQARQATEELLDAAGLTEGDVFVIGCSSSEITGGRIGHASSLEAAQAVFRGVFPPLRERGIFMAAQCCEHLNRALIVERACAARYGWEPVSVRPQPKAGGSFATTAWENFQSPAAVEHPGPCGDGYRRNADRYASAGRGGAGAPASGSHRRCHPPLRPHPAQIYRRQPGLLRVASRQHIQTSPHSAACRQKSRRTQ